MNDQKITFLDTLSSEPAIPLIEEAFQYSSEHSFKTDFLPLFHSSFKSGAHFAIKDDVIIGHIAYSLRQITIKETTYSVAFLGGIAVAPPHRGQGIFHQLMQMTLNKLEGQVAFFVLWSSENTLYERYDFRQCGHVYQWGNQSYEAPIVKNVHCLSDYDIEQMSQLYNHCWPNRVLRSAQQWQALKEMTSVQVYLEINDQEIISYALKGKGFDLTDIVHEFAAKDLTQFARHHGHQKIWSPQCDSSNFEQKLWLGMARAGQLWQSSNSLEDFLNTNQIMIGGIDSI